MGFKKLQRWRKLLKELTYSLSLFFSSFLMILEKMISLLDLYDVKSKEAGVARMVVH